MGTAPSSVCRTAASTRNQHNFSLTSSRSANLCDGVEDDLGKLDVSQKRIQLKFQPHEVLTVVWMQGSNEPNGILIRNLAIAQREPSRVW